MFDTERTLQTNTSIRCDFKIAINLTFLQEYDFFNRKKTNFFTHGIKSCRSETYHFFKVHIKNQILICLKILQLWETIAQNSKTLLIQQVVPPTPQLPWPEKLGIKFNAFPAI